MNTYDIGDLVVIEAGFVVDGDSTDPTALVFSIREPDDTVTMYTYGSDVELERVSEGNFRVLWSATQGGVHHYRIAGTGDAQAAEERAFMVNRSTI